MIFKWIGAIFVIAGCGGVGIKLAASHINEERTLRKLISILDFMSCELQYRLTPLPELCRQVAAESTGVLSEIFLSLARELEDQVKPDVYRCMYAVLSMKNNVPEKTRKSLELLGRSLGRFDIDGQLRGLEGVRQSSRRSLDALSHNQDIRLRGYQTLALCAGAALVILFI